jgi:transcriptional regulator with XRE-family HTH domain
MISTNNSCTITSMELKERIKEARKKAGLNQSELARLINKTPQTVQQWEAGKTSPKGDNLLNLAQALRVTPEWLQFGKESRVPANLVSLHGGGLPVPNSAPNDLVAQDSDEEMMLRFLRMMTDEQRQETLNSAKKVYDHNQEIMEKLSSRKRA